MLATPEVGSGKSTLIKFIIAALNIPKEKVCYIAYTGKAASVLKAKGCPNATTAHRLLYKAKPMPDGTFIYQERDIPPGTYDVCVVDEISMLPNRMWQLLLKKGIYVLACGDPEQLPPIDKDDSNNALENPHIFLDEIMRQAQDSEIIRLSMWVREGKPISAFPCIGEQVKIIHSKELTGGMYEWADQCICSTNDMRNTINNIIRKRRGYGELPAPGDKIIGLTNHWEVYSDAINWNLTNGTIGTIDNYYIEKKYLPRHIKTTPINYMWTNMKLDDGDGFSKLPIDYQSLITGKTALTDKESYLLNKAYKAPPVPFNFTYAYAITCWKAQGSEWDKVLLFEEKFPHDKDTHRRALYTGITRAAKKLVVVVQD